MIDLSKTDKWIQVCAVEGNELYFTPEYLSITSCLGWGARKLAAHLAAGWDKDMEGMLDYFGPEDVEDDWYTGIDGDTMDVCEVIPNKLEEDQIVSENLDAEWHRDLFRAKLASLKIPQKLLNKYVSAIQKERER